MSYFRASVFQEERKTLQNYNLFLNLQNFSRFFLNFFFQSLPAYFPHRLPARRNLRPKSECKVRPFFRILQIFSQKYFLKICSLTCFSTQIPTNQQLQKKQNSFKKTPPKTAITPQKPIRPHKKHITPTISSPDRLILTPASTSKKKRISTKFCNFAT